MKLWIEDDFERLCARVDALIDRLEAADLPLDLPAAFEEWRTLRRGLEAQADTPVMVAALSNVVQHMETWFAQLRAN